MSLGTSPCGWPIPGRAGRRCPRAGMAPRHHRARPSRAPGWAWQGSPSGPPPAAGLAVGMGGGGLLAAGGLPEVTRVAGGRSNLPYRLGLPVRSLVLRRPPLGHVLPTAHDMNREFRVLTALAGTAVPVPRTLALC